MKLLDNTQVQNVSGGDSWEERQQLLDLIREINERNEREQVPFPDEDPTIF